jgi:hypothetical protein
MPSADERYIWEAFKEAKTPLHWSTRQDEIKQQQRDAEIPRVTCFCDDCVHWSAGNKCVAESIELSYGWTDDQVARGEQICECQTYVSTGESDEG